MREYASADFNHPGKILNRTKKMKKSVYDANNARNRDSYTLTNSIGMLKSDDKILKYSSSTQSSNLNEVEETLITLIDLKNNKS